VKILPVSGEKHGAYGAEVLAALRAAGARAELDAADESLGKKIRNGKTEKVPYLLVVGDAEVEAKTLSVESRDNGKLGALDVDTFVAQVKNEIESRA
jgi:threonyl-tRNA synthetase